MVKDYIEYFNKLDTGKLFESGVSEKLDCVSNAYGHLDSDEVILETRLDSDEKVCDYSIKNYTEIESVKEHWYELDHDAITGAGIIPCMFMDASFLRPGMAENEAETFIDCQVAEFAGTERTGILKPQLLKVLKVFAGKCDNLYQLGVMTSRNQSSSMRVFTSAVSVGDISAALRELNWSGDTDRLTSFLDEIEKYSRSKEMIFDFDIKEDRISSRIGINFDLCSYSQERLERWMDYLVENKLCSREKARGVTEWAFTPPQFKPFVINDISHFKFAYDGGVIASKVYLRQGSVAKRPFNWLFRPSLMNLELTDRCPLHCPQCYCDLNKGRDMDLDTALYWIREAAKERLDTINLSGGESILYDGLTELVRECRKNDMRPNVAFSGWGLTKEKIEELIEAGIDGIFISLNGSTEAINSFSRDGYKYAINALTILKEIGFEKTCINWVMHSSNADDFENMLKLCEEYSVAELAVMVFKPNASHELPGEPSAEQIKKLAATIKNYRGSIKIEVEPCFSQLKALLGQRFFTNLNRGYARGCGAGRDGISISAEGRLSPCRHLEFYEDHTTIKDYWEQSEVLKELREMETHMDEKCTACKYNKYCLPCAAVNVKLKGYIGMGHASCGLS